MKQKRISIMVGLLLCTIAQTFAQEFTGRVTDSSDNPIPFANVLFVNLQDSSFIVGTVTDESGSYQMKCSEPIEKLLVKATYIGYLPFVGLYKELNGGNIILHDATTQIDEVVVKASRPTFKMDAGALTANIANTTLSHLGDASDVLAQLPFLSGSDGKFIVFGRGEPIIYINNNRMRNQADLSKLKSDQIKDIQVILNPGAEYDAGTGAIIKITTLRPVGEGLSGMVQGMVIQKRSFGHTEAGSLNYRKGGLDLFAYGYNKALTNQQNQRTVMQFPFQEELFRIANDGSMKSEFKDWELEGGVSYSPNAKYALGMRYTFDKDVDTPFRSSAAMDVTHDSQQSPPAMTNQEVWQKGQRQNLNMYYQGSLSEKTVLHIDGDYIKGNKYDRNTTIVTADNQPKESDKISSTSESNYQLYAGKMWIKSTLWSGELLGGVEASYTDNRQWFDMLTTEMEDDIPNSKNRSQQTALAPFATYAKGWGQWNANIGLRYEYVNFDYYLNGERQAAQSKVYNNLFPTLSLAYSKNRFSTSFSYRNLMTRPSYYQLRSSISYNDPFTYEGGNPALLPAIEHRFSLLFSYKDLQFSADYQLVKDQVLFTMIPYVDKPVNLFSTMNQDMNRYALYAAYAPTISLWKPTFSVGLQGQRLTYRGRSYNKPIFTYGWRNLLQLSPSLLAVVNLEGNSYGNMELSAAQATFRMNVSVRKELFKGRLRLTLGAQDLLNTQRERWSMLIGDTYLNKWNDSDARSLYFNVVYRFNATRSNYQGDRAAESEINRL